MQNDANDMPKLFALRLSMHRTPVVAESLKSVERGIWDGKKEAPTDKFSSFNLTTILALNG